MVEEAGALTLRAMEIEDYDGVFRLWNSIHGFGIRSQDDSREGIARFLRRNPGNSVVAEADGEIVGAILCGHDGRRGCMYHVCVSEKYRNRGIGSRMAEWALARLREEGINKVSLIAFCSNEIGNAFWRRVGWTFREDLNYYDFTLNAGNVTEFVD